MTTVGLYEIALYAGEITGKRIEVKPVFKGA